MYVLKNKTQNTIVAAQTLIAKTYWQRFLGLMFRKSMETSEALVFYRAPSIHMFFMNFAIDVIFLDKNMRVVKIVSGLKPYRLANCFNSYCTIELADGVAEKTVAINDEIELFSPDI